MDKSVYKRPEKPRFILVKRRERDFALNSTNEWPELLTVDRSTECHVTPQKIALSMVDYLEVENGMSVADPQCGTGSLIAALKESGKRLNICGIELNLQLVRSCEKRFHNESIELVNSCFIEYASANARKFDRIISNPPFRNIQRHIAASLTMLAPGGVLVALVPVTFDHENATHLENIERGAFSLTNVATKIISLNVE